MFQQMEKALGRLSEDDISRGELAGERSHSCGRSQQTDMVAVQTPAIEQCGQVTLLVTWKSLSVFQKRQTSQFFLLD